MKLEKSDIQGNILKGYRLPKAAQLFFEISNVPCAKRLLAGLEITTAAPWPSKPDSTLNIAFGYRGLHKLRDVSAMGAAFEAFGMGMQRRAKLLMDSPKESGWEHVDVWISIHAKDEARLTARLASLLRAAEGALTLRKELCTSAIELGERCYEHFGFQDDISNPEIEGAEVPSDPPEALNLGSGKLDAQGKLSRIRAGELLLGYENESGERGPDGELGRFVKNGTFAVVRQLAQDVLGFRRQMASLARDYGGAPDQWAAWIVGRKRDGTPLSQPVTDRTLNNFKYGDDPEGARCPIGAHIRRSHPRDAFGMVDGTHRIMRRGMPYGPPLPESAEQDDGQPRGLFFVALNASIERQFEFVHTRWINAGPGVGIKEDGDPLTGSRQVTRLVVQGDRASGRLPVVVPALPSFVSLVGGGYFFVPGLAALKTLSALPDRELTGGAP
jgi:Dyp-type peroxidase family